MKPNPRHYICSYIWSFWKYSGPKFAFSFGYINQKPGLVIKSFWVSLYTHTGMHFIYMLFLGSKTLTGQPLLGNSAPFGNSYFINLPLELPQLLINVTQMNLFKNVFEFIQIQQYSLPLSSNYIALKYIEINTLQIQQLHCTFLTQIFLYEKIIRISLCMGIAMKLSNKFFLVLIKTLIGQPHLGARDPFRNSF